MRIPIDWLNEYLERDLTTAKMAAALELAGVEVEGIIPAADLDDRIVVGQIEKVSAHPNADKLQVVKVDTGESRLTIVTGAPGIAAGQKVPVAQVGSELPDGTEIKKAKLRGVESDGMLCSERELDVSQNHENIMVLAPDFQVGTKVAEVLSGIDVIDTTTSANRWDLNGMVGLAREVAAHSGQKSTVKSPEHQNSSKPLEAVASPELAARYLLAKLKVDAGKATPPWLGRRLQAAGIRQVNVVVDITNYVMLECGQPLHAFDGAKVKPPLSVRRAVSGEKLVTLDGNTHTLDPEDIVIADTASAIGLAGVMGGRNSEIETVTTEIYLEAASFPPADIRRTAVRHGLRSDASSRFERTIPVELPPIALARAVQLLEEFAAAKLVAGPADPVAAPAVETRITVDPERISALLGLEVDKEKAVAELAKLEIATDAGGTDLTVTPPWWRPDLRHEVDIAEELIKLIGYEQLPATLPAWAPADITFDRRWPDLWRAKSVLRSLGLFEIVTYSFISEDQITTLGRAPDAHLKLKNPLSIEQAYLRTDLLPSLLRVAERNRTYARQFGVFEFSKVYHARGTGELPDERLRLGVLVRAEAESYRLAKAALDRLATEFGVGPVVVPGAPEAMVAHPTRAAAVKVGEAPLGWIGQLHPRLVAGAKLGGEVAYLELEWQPWVELAAPKLYQSISRFPSVVRDLSLELDREVTWQQVAAALSEYRISFLSEYYGDDLAGGKKAVAFRVTLTSPEKTLTDAEADQTIRQIVGTLSREFDAVLR